MTDREYRKLKREIRRKREHRRRVFLATTLFLAVFAASISIYSISSAAGQDTGVEKSKYFTEITVAGDDTLWSIAKANIDYDCYKSIYSYIDEVKFINHLEDDDIRKGEVLVIPYYSSEYK